jgi:sphingomyelin phosphodiesterase
MSKNNTICPGIVKMMGDVIVPTLTKFALAPDYVCSKLVQSCDDVDFKILHHDDYIHRVLKDKPHHIQENNYLNNMYKTVQANGGPRKTFKAVHYSDAHVDLQYTPGTNQHCTTPLCCRPENGFTDNPDDQAGYWGSYNCDTAPPTIRLMFETIRDEIKPDVVFWSGDMSAHSVWENDNEEVIEVNKYVADLVEEILGDTVTVYPIMGNHDVWPVNVQSFLQPNPILQSLTSTWSKWLKPETMKTFSIAGYYSQYFEIKGQGKQAKMFDKTRVLGVTTQVCNPQNWYLWEIMSDPAGELAWLESVLQDMEAKGENAILLGHMPISSCLRAWGTRFQALAERYQHVIRFGIFGHSHSEKFFLTTTVKRDNDVTTIKPISFNSILAPTTTYQGKNPSFAVYEIDEESMLIVNATTYFFNITQANQGNPKWEVYHNILEAYGIPDMSPDSFYSYAEKLLTNEEEALKFNMWNAKGGPDGDDLDGSCNEKCRRRTFCSLVTSTTDDEDECKEAIKKSFSLNIDEFHFSEDAFYEFMAGPWVEKVYLE